MHIDRQLQAHFGETIWPELWYDHKPIIIYRSMACGLTAEEIQLVLGRINTHAPEVGLPHPFFQLKEEEPEQGNPGVWLFGKAIPAWVYSRPLYETQAILYLSVVSGRSLQDSPPQQPFTLARVWPLTTGTLAESVDYGLGGLTHELLHALGISDHYYLMGSQGREGVWDPNSIMGNPGINAAPPNTPWPIVLRDYMGFPQPHDVADLKEFYSQKFHGKETKMKWSGVGKKVTIRVIAPPNNPNTTRQALLTIEVARSVPSGKHFDIWGTLRDVESNKPIKEIDPTHAPIFIYIRMSGVETPIPVSGDTWGASLVAPTLTQDADIEIEVVFRGD